MKRLRFIILSAAVLCIIFSVTASATAEEYTAYSSFKTGQTIDAANVREDASVDSALIASVNKDTIFTLRGYKNADNGTMWYRVIYDGKNGYVSSKKVEVISKKTYTIYTPYMLGTVNEEKVNIREGAGTSYDIRGTATEGTKFTVYGYKSVDGIKWYRITYNGKASYISSNYVTLTKKQGELVTYSKEKTGKATAKVAVRKTASSEDTCLGYLAKNEKVTLKGYRLSTYGKKWYKILYNGKAGYVSASYIDIVDTLSYTIYTPLKTGKVTSDSLNVRAGASASSTLKGKISKNTVVTLRGYKYDSENVKWYRIIYNGKAAYINSNYVDIVSAYSYTIYTPWKTGKATEKVPVRKTASSDAARLGYISASGKVTLKGYCTGSDGKKWYRITYDESAGYVLASYIDIVDTLSYTLYTPSKKFDAIEDVTVRGSASESGTSKGTISDGKTITAAGYKYDSAGNKWYKITYNGKAAYVKASCFVSNIDEYLSDQGFPKSYWPYLKKLHESHPSWVFKAQKTGISWDDVIDVEAGVGKSLYDGSIDSWKSMKKGCYDFDTGKYVGFDGSTWVTAYTGLVKYYVDPRNYLNESYIYAFLSHKFDSDSQSISTVKKVVDGTFLDNAFPESSYETYSSCIYYAAKNADMNANLLAAMIIQEQGTKGKSSLISGTYDGYEGYYNYLNIGAYSSGSLTAVERGLKYAKGDYTDESTEEKYLLPWNSRAKAIKGAALSYASWYINNNQYTLYLKKWNVMNGKSKVGYHQYMSNVEGAADESWFLSKTYSSMESKAIVFSIPVYNDMPESAAKLPTKTGNNNNLLDKITVSGYSLNKTFERYESSYTITVPSSVSQIKITAKANDQDAKVTGAGTVTLSSGTNKIKIKVKSTSGLTRTYTITVNRS